MGQLRNVGSIKLSDFIDESFLEDLEVDADNRDPGAEKSDRKGLSELMKALCDESATRLPMTKNNQSLHALSNKRRKVSGDGTDVQATHLILSPLLAMILNETETLLSQDWRRRQMAACTLRVALSTLHQLRVSSLDFYTVQRKSDDGQLQVSQQEEMPMGHLVRNILPRLLVFILKDNFSDFEGLKVQVPAREEAMKLLAEIQYLSEISSAEGGLKEALEGDMKTLLQILPAIFLSIEKDLWHSRLNFFLIIKALVLKPSPNSHARQTVLAMFSQLLIMCLPQIEDEPKVAITEILQILLPTYLEMNSKPPFSRPSRVVQTVEKLLANLTTNLQQSDEIEASAISVFNLVCRIFDLKETHECLQPLSFKLCLKTFCPFNFHKFEAVRYSYNVLLSKCLGQKEHNLDLGEISQLHTLVVQALAMETSPTIVKTLYKVLGQTVRIFASFESAPEPGVATEDNGAAQAEQPAPSAYGQYLRDTLLAEARLPAWLCDVQPNFDSFLFCESANFESVTNDYFEIVFKPANEQEWDTLHNQKTAQLTKAIAIMLANCKEQDAANMLFESLCARTAAYDMNEEAGGYEQRTLLNQSMLHLMLTMDRYTRLLGKQRAQGNRDGAITPNAGGLLDLGYLQDLSGQFLGAQVKDVNVSECWQWGALFEQLRSFGELAQGRGLQQMAEQCGAIEYYLNDFQQTLSFQFEMEFKEAVEALHDWTRQQGDSYLYSCF